MGVDARMFARIRGRDKWLKPEEVLAAARDLASVFGPENFFISKGQDMFEKNASTWGRTHHALSIREPFSKETAEEYESPEYEGRVVWTQDGDPIFAMADEQFVEVHLMERYYGPEYARGNWPIIRGVAEWLEERFPGCEVWYGGDSSGICAEPFTYTKRDQINRFFLRSGHSTYGNWTSIFDKGNRPVTCSTCEAPMRTCGGGQDRTFWYCPSCDAKAISTPTDVTILPRGKDFFDLDKDPPQQQPGATS